MNAIIENIKHYPLVVCSAIIVLICVVLNVMRGDVVAAHEQQESDLYSRVRVIEKNKINANGLKAELEQLQTQAASIEERLFDPDKNASNANFFYALEDEVDVLVTKVNLLGREDPLLGKGGAYELKKYASITYEIMVEGAFADLIRFMHELHAAKPLMRVADFQIMDGASSAIPGALIVNMRVLVLANKE